MESAETVKRDLCPGCCSKTADHACPKTLKNLDSVTVVGYYHDPKLRAVIHALKYKGATCLEDDIGNFCSRWKQRRLEPWPWAGAGEIAIQHLSGSPRRIRERGFDQALVLSKIFRQTVVPWANEVDILDRRDGLLSQAALDPGELRKANVTGCFSAKIGVSIPGIVILVDDVITTGSTMDEAARILRQAGAKNVYGLALAIGA